jgi:uncharacterized membrane protein YfcA
MAPALPRKEPMMTTHIKRNRLLRPLALAFGLAMVGASLGSFLAQLITRRRAVPAISA